ncbi:ankyrin repeat-containing domain protein, partial [Amylocarpus encephaloides]
ACSNSYLDLVRKFLKSGALVDIETKRGMTPLSWATIGGHTPLVTVLLERGADRLHVDREGMTPLH